MIEMLVHIRTRPLAGWLIVLAIALLAPMASSQGKPDKTAPAASASGTSSPPAGLAQSLTGQARADYEAARVLYGDGDFSGALLKFTHAWEQSRDPRLLWNMAACEKNLRHYAKVLGLVRRYVAEGGALLTEQDRQESRELMATVETFTAQLKLTINEPGASVFVDGEPVGTSPIGPVLVDLGTRKVRVEKPGFAPYQASVPVGASREIAHDVQLVKELHEGRVTVKSTAGARILLDGKEVGRGTWSGAVPSGGHMLQIVADGMLPYQSELVVQDGENRMLEIALTRMPERQTTQVVVVQQKRPEASPRSFELGLRSGYGVVYPRGEAASLGAVGFVPLWLEVGHRRGKVASLGFFLQVAGYDHGQTCGVDRHGPAALGPGDLQVRYSYTNCMHFAGGFQALFHMLPSMKIDPWFGFDLGGQYSVRKYRRFDPLTARYGTGTDGGPSGALGLQLGVDFRLWRGLGFGPFVRAAMLVGEDLKARESKGSDLWGDPVLGCSAGATCSDAEKKSATTWPQLTFGLRAGYTF